MNTDIGGDLSEDELLEEINRIKEVYPESYTGYFNAKPAPFKTKFDTRNNYIIVHADCHDDYKKYLTPDQQKWWVRERRYHLRLNSDYLCSQTLGIAFPYHQLFLSFITPKYAEGCLKALTDLEYSLIEQRKSNYDMYWSDKNRYDMLRTLRSKDNLSKAFDARAADIVKKINDSIDGILAFHFATFSPKRRTARSDDWYDHFSTEPNDEKGLNFGKLCPVKSIECIPNNHHALSQLETMTKELQYARAVGLTSKVITDDGFKYIPMIDFASEISLVSINDTLDKISMRGMIIKSGLSHHFYGFELQSFEQHRNFIKSLKEHYSVCGAYPDLQLEQGFSMLRLTPATNRLYQPCIHNIYLPKLPKPDNKPENIDNLERLESQLKIA